MQLTEAEKIAVGTGLAAIFVYSAFMIRCTLRLLP